MRRYIVSITAACAFLVAVESPSLAVDCETLTPPPVYITGSSALKPLLKGLGQALRSTMTDPAKRRTIVYPQSSSSCDAIQAFSVVSGAAGKKLLTNGQMMFYIDDAGTEVACAMTADRAPDLGVSDVFFNLCPGASKPADVADISGPAQAMVFVTHPQAMQQRAISAEQAYLALNLGTMSDTPWNDPTVFYSRSNGSGTKLLLAKAIGLDVQYWHEPTANQLGGSGAVVTAIGNAPAASIEKVLAILGSDVVDERGPTAAKKLAFRGFKQLKAYWPDSSFSATDKKNVRDGHYVAFGYAHLIGDAPGGNLSNTEAKNLADLITGKVDLSATFTYKDTIGVLAKKGHVVPQCAMKVQRSIDGGPLSSYSPDKPCGCLWESQFTPKGALPTGCTACAMDGECGTGKCNYGFCEAR